MAAQLESDCPDACGIKLELPNGEHKENVIFSTYARSQDSGCTVGEEKKRLMSEHYSAGLATVDDFVLVIVKENGEEMVLRDNERMVTYIGHFNEAKIVNRGYATDKPGRTVNFDLLSNVRPRQF